MIDDKFPTGDPPTGSGSDQPAVDAKARDEDRKYFPTEEDQNLAAYRGLRKDAFYWMGGVCLAYLIVLLVVLVNLFDDGSALSKALSENVVTNWHPLVLMGIALAIFATVPLTLAMGILHMASEGRSGSAEKSGVKLPAAEAVKIAVDAALKAAGK